MGHRLQRRRSEQHNPKTGLNSRHIRANKLMGQRLIGFAFREQASELVNGECWYHQLGTVYTVKWTVCMLVSKKSIDSCR
jgi:hypothetical protein